MPTLAEIKAKADTLLAALDAKIATKQAAHFAAKGRYLQLRDTHATPPADGTDTAPAATWAPVYSEMKRVPDGVDAKGQPKSRLVVATDPTWEAVPTMPAAQCASVKIDVYDGPKGPGWTLTATVKVTATGETWTRTIHHGPEARVAGWVKQAVGK